LVFSAADGLCAELQQVGDSADAAAAAAEGLAHGTMGKRLVFEAYGTVAAAPELHGASLMGQLDSWQNQVSAGKSKNRRNKKKKKKKKKNKKTSCEQ
jgi:cytochrome c5